MPGKDLPEKGESSYSLISYEESVLFFLVIILSAFAFLGTHAEAFNPEGLLESKPLRLASEEETQRWKRHLIKVK
jgi:hypothetical protein